MKGLPSKGLRSAALFVALAGVLITIAGCGGGGGGGGGSTQPTSQAAQQATAILNTQGQARDYYQQLSSQNDPSAIQKTVNWLKTQSNVQNAGIGDDGTTICIKYSNGIEGMILTSALQQNLTTASRSPLARFASLASNQLKRFQKYVLTHFCPSSAFADSNKKALILLPLQSQAHHDDTSLSYIENALTNSGYSAPDVLLNGDVTVDQMGKLQQYQFVYITTHGGLGGGSLGFGFSGASLMTGEEATLSKLTNWATSYSTGVVVVTADLTHLYFGVNEAFFNQYTYPSTLIFANACSSDHNDSLRKAFLDHGAALYVGWDQISYLSLSNNFINPVLFLELSKPGMTFDQAYKNTVAKYFPISVGVDTMPNQDPRMRGADGTELSSNTQDTKVNYTLTLKYDGNINFILDPLPGSPPPPPGGQPPEAAYLQVSPERVLTPGFSGPVTLTFSVPTNADNANILFTPPSCLPLSCSSGEQVPLTRVSQFQWSGTFDNAKLFQYYVSGEPHTFVGYCDLYQGATRTIRYNLFLPVRSSAMPSVTIHNLAVDRQTTDHVLNLRYDVLFLGGTTSTFSSVWNAIQTTASSITGQRDFYALVGQVDAFTNSTGGTVLTFSHADSFDLASRAAVHEMGHKWLAHSNNALISGDPHWALGNAAYGIMGWTAPGNGEGLDFPYQVQPGVALGTTQLWSAQASTRFNQLELYKMGAISKQEVSPILQFSDQASARSWMLNPTTLPSCGNGCQVLAVPSTYVSIDDIIASDGPTAGATQTSFTLGTIVLSSGRLLTANEMAYFEYMAARGEGTASVQVWDGFVSYMGLPFSAATTGLLTVTTGIH